MESDRSTFMSRNDIDIFIIVLRIVIKNSFLLPKHSRSICSTINSSLPQKMRIQGMGDLNKLISLEKERKLRVNSLTISDPHTKTFYEINSTRLHEMTNLTTLSIDIDTKLNIFPPNITHLELGWSYKFALDNLLPNLTHLTVGSPNYSYDKLPSTLLFLETEFDFNEPVDNLPELRTLILNQMFNQPIDNLPFTLTHLTLKYKFNHPINHLPQCLTHLTLGEEFNQPIDHLPPNLKYLELGESFNQSIDKIPRTITHLILGKSFNQSIENLNHNLILLKLGTKYDVPIHTISSTLRELHLSSNFNHPIDHLIDSLCNLEILNQRESIRIPFVI